MKNISFSEAANQALIDTQKPVVSDFDLSIIIVKLLTSRTYNKSHIRLRQGEINQGSLARRIRSIERGHIIAPDPDFSRDRATPKIRFGANVWWVSGAPKGTAEDVACLTDPFCYISHLSAMQRYGLSERNPKNLILSSYNRKTWDSMRDAYEEQKLANLFPCRIKLSRISIPPIIRGRSIEIHESRHAKISINVVDTFSRISEIGTTFADMLERPELCGGMSHVLNVWEKEASLYLNDIIQAVGRSPKKIIKVRAGYILDEYIGLKDARIESWQQFATRGGDQKLDPYEKYCPSYSEKWKISLNV